MNKVDIKRTMQKPKDIFDVNCFIYKRTLRSDTFFWQLKALTVLKIFLKFLS